MSKKLNREEHTKKQVIWMLWLHDYLHRHYNNQTSEKENQTIAGWNPDNSTGASYEPSHIRMNEGIKATWDALSDRYEFNNLQKKKVRVFRIQKMLPYAAAVLLLLMTSVTAYQYNTYGSVQSLGYLFSDRMVYTTGNSDVKNFILPDGSSITLNGNTTIALVKNEFNDEKREVWLEDGEVFFDVTKNPKKRFIIHSTDADVMVKGTSFTVTAYKKLNISSVAVRTGKVQVTKNNKKLGLLTPAQNLVIDKRTGEVKVSEIKTSSIAVWRERNLAFNQSGADELILRMEQHFDVDIKVEPGLLSDINFSATFEKETHIKNVLDVLAEIYGIKYSITDIIVTLYK